jgi:arylformamidase
VQAGGASIEACDLSAYLGLCQVVRVAAVPGSAIEPAQIEDEITAPRVLLATETAGDRTVFADDFAGLSVALADWLHARGVVLVGVDTPSVDRFANEALPVHRRLVRHGVAILEGLVLERVPAGTYELIALPLRLGGFDASPVRAVLRTVPA